MKNWGMDDKLFRVYMCVCACVYGRGSGWGERWEIQCTVQLIDSMDEGAKARHEAVLRKVKNKQRQKRPISFTHSGNVP